MLKNKIKFYYNLSLVYQLGLSLIIPQIICIAGGVTLDKQFKTSPLFVLFGVFLGLLISGMSLYYDLLPFLKKTKKDKNGN
jgi:hypothetical protein